MRRYCRDVIEIKRITDYIERHLEGDVSLGRLSREAGVSRFHLQRSFKAAVGVTPRQYAEACRLRSLKQNLRDGSDVLESVFAAGFGSSSRVYEKVDTRLGMTPSEYRKGGSVARDHSRDGGDVAGIADDRRDGPGLVLCAIRRERGVT